MKILKAQHGSRYAFYSSMILLNHVVQIFTLTNFNSLVVIFVEFFDRGGVSAGLIGVD